MVKGVMMCVYECWNAGMSGLVSRTMYILVYTISSELPPQTTGGRESGSYLL